MSYELKNLENPCKVLYVKQNGYSSPQSAPRPQRRYKSGDHIVERGFFEREELPEESVLQEQIEKLDQIGIALSSEIDIEKLLELIVYEDREFTGADGGSLYILDQNRLYFHVAQNETLSKRSDPPPGFKPYALWRTFSYSLR